MEEKEKKTNKKKKHQPQRKETKSLSAEHPFPLQSRILLIFLFFSVYTFIFFQSSPIMAI